MGGVESRPSKQAEKEKEFRDMAYKESTEAAPFPINPITGVV